MTSPIPTAVRMLCSDVGTAPRHALPCGYALRGFQPGDEDSWVAIHRRADRLQESSLALFEQQFGMARGELPRRQFYLLDGQARPIGTASAWFGSGDSPRSRGRVHWVALVPEAQGRGLGKVLLSAVCCRFLELGHRQAYLTTSTLRLPALCLYFGFGFLPDLTSPLDRAAWRHLLLPPTAPGPGLPSTLRAWLETHLQTIAGT